MKKCGADAWAAGGGEIVMIQHIQEFRANADFQE